MRMKATFLFLSMLCLCWTATGNRSKRNVLELGSVISCISGISVLDVLFKLDGYGCYCGLGGKGTPKDDVDECCQLHDNCYDDAITNGDCPGNTPYTTVYRYKAEKSCGTPEAMISCDDEGSYGGKDDARCAVDLCECDLKIAKCLKNKRFNPKYEKYDKNTC